MTTTPRSVQVARSLIESSFADSFRVSCERCGGDHSDNLTCREHRGQTAIRTSLTTRRRWENETAARLSALVGDQHLYPLLTLCKIGYSASQLTQAVSKLLVELAQPRVPVRHTEGVVSGVGVRHSITHHSLLTAARAATRYVAGALLLTALWQLQRKAAARRAAADVLRPSGATRTEVAS